MALRPPVDVSVTREPVAIQSGALAHLRYIRATMEAAHAFTSVPGKGCVAMGLVAFAAAALSSWPEVAGHWLAIWIGAAVLAVALVTLFLVDKLQQQGFSLWRGVARRFFLVLAPALVAGGVLTAALAPTAAARALVPGAWLLLYGAGLAAAGVFSLPVVSITGCAFMLLGAFALALPGWGIAWLAAGFGGLHIALGIVVWRKHGG